MSTFCQGLYHRKCRGVGGQKSQNIVHVVCERPPISVNASTYNFMECPIHFSRGPGLVVT